MGRKHWWLVKQKDGEYVARYMTWKRMESFPPKRVYKMYYETKEIADKVLAYKKKNGGFK